MTEKLLMIKVINELLQKCEDIELLYLIQSLLTQNNFNPLIAEK